MEIFSPICVHETYGLDVDTVLPPLTAVIRLEEIAEERSCLAHDRPFLEIMIKDMEESV